MTQLSDDQVVALEAIQSAMSRGDRTMVLVGPAGSGKTTLMRSVVAAVEDDGARRVVLICPTGKAATVLAGKTDRPATTIHLYGSHDDEGEELVFGDPGAPCGEGDLLVCDEASMVGSEIHNDLMEWLPASAQLLYVGDREQLEPVNDTWGPDFDLPTAALVEVHRQASESPIIRLATAIRTGRPFAEWEPWRCERIEGGDPSAWLVDRMREGDDAVLITFTNKMRQDINARVRAMLGYHGDPKIGEPLLVLANNYECGLMNGEVAHIERGQVCKKKSGHYRTAKVRLTGGIMARVNLDLMGRPVRDFNEWIRTMRRHRRETKDILHVDFGYCLTVHKAQGSEWRSVGFVSCPATRNLRDHDFRRRLGYTAVTRARERLVIFRTGRA